MSTWALILTDAPVTLLHIAFGALAAIHTLGGGACSGWAVASFFACTSTSVVHHTICALYSCWTDQTRVSNENKLWFVKSVMAKSSGCVNVL